MVGGTKENDNIEKGELGVGHVLYPSPRGVFANSFIFEGSVVFNKKDVFPIIVYQNVDIKV